MILIKNTEIMIALGDDNYHTLFHNMNKYTTISLSEVQDIIKDGVTDIYERYEALVAWLLKLTKYIPAGWKPEPRKLVYKKQQQLNLPMPSTQDRNSKNTLASAIIRGKEHHAYGKNGLAKHNESKFIRKYTYANNSSRVKEIIHLCGGALAVSIICAVSERTVRDWSKLTKRNTQGYFPQKYIYPLSKFARDYNLSIYRAELESFLPPKYEDYL